MLFTCWLRVKLRAITNRGRLSDDNKVDFLIKNERYVSETPLTGSGFNQVRILREVKLPGIRL